MHAWHLVLRRVIVIVVIVMVIFVVIIVVIFIVIAIVVIVSFIVGVVIIIVVILSLDVIIIVVVIGVSLIVSVVIGIVVIIVSGMDVVWCPCGPGILLGAATLILFNRFAHSELGISFGSSVGNSSNNKKTMSISTRTSDARRRKGRWPNPEIGPASTYTTRYL